LEKVNSCVLVAKIIAAPELRYTQDNQTPFAQMLVEFQGSNPQDSSYTLRATGWGSLATEIAETYGEGDQVILEGRLEMRTFDRPEGFKEKRAQMILSHIYRMEGYLQPSNHGGSRSDNVVEMNEFKSQSTAPKSTPKPEPQEVTTQRATPEPIPASSPSDSPEGTDLDDIPF
jgi:single-stranded DNA-binding protein